MRSSLNPFVTPKSRDLKMPSSICPGLTCPHPHSNLLWWFQATNLQGWSLPAFSVQSSPRPDPATPAPTQTVTQQQHKMLSLKNSVWQIKCSIIICLNSKRRTSPLPQPVLSSCSAPVPQRKAFSSDQSSVSWEGPQAPKTHTRLTKWFFIWQTDQFGIDTIPA